MLSLVATWVIAQLFCFDINFFVGRYSHQWDNKIVLNLESWIPGIILVLMLRAFFCFLLWLLLLHVLLLLLSSTVSTTILLLLQTVNVIGYFFCCLVHSVQSILLCIWWEVCYLCFEFIVYVVNSYHIMEITLTTTTKSLVQFADIVIFCLEVGFLCVCFPEFQIGAVCK